MEEALLVHPAFRTEEQLGDLRLPTTTAIRNRRQQTFSLAREERRAGVCL